MTGPTGKEGPSGKQGNMGPQGTPGPKGEAGHKGRQGVWLVWEEEKRNDRGGHWCDLMHGQTDRRNPEYQHCKHLGMHTSLTSLHIDSISPPPSTEELEAARDSVLSSLSYPAVLCEKACYLGNDVH